MLSDTTSFKVLFVEEEETDFLDTIMSLVNEAMSEVVHVQSPQQALLCLYRKNYNIVLLDLPDANSCADN